MTRAESVDTLRVCVDGSHRAGDPQEGVTLDPLEEALVELARSALRNRREVAERRGKMAIVLCGKRGGRTA